MTSNIPYSSIKNIIHSIVKLNDIRNQPVFIFHVALYSQYPYHFEYTDGLHYCIPNDTLQINIIIYRERYRWVVKHSWQSDYFGERPIFGSYIPLSVLKSEYIQVFENPNIYECMDYIIYQDLPQVIKLLFDRVSVKQNAIRYTHTRVDILEIANENRDKLENGLSHELEIHFSVYKDAIREDSLYDKHVSYRECITEHSLECLIFNSNKQTDKLISHIADYISNKHKLIDRLFKLVKLSGVCIY